MAHPGAARRQYGEEYRGDLRRLRQLRSSPRPCGCWTRLRNSATPYPYKVLMGGEAIDAYGDPLPQSELDSACKATACCCWEPSAAFEVGGLPGDKRAEGLLRLRAGMGLLQQPPCQKSGPSWRTPRPEARHREKGIDFIVVRDDRRRLLGAQDP